MDTGTKPRVIPILAQAQDGADGLFSAYEKQLRIYPRAVHGWFANWRWLMVGLTQAVFYGLPGLQLATPVELQVPAIGIAWLLMRLTLPPEQAEPLRGRAREIEFTISRLNDDDKRSSTERSTFFVPR